VRDLFGFLLLFLLEEKAVQDAAEKNRLSGWNPIVDHQSHALRRFQRMRLCFVLFYRPDSKPSSFPVAV
jgi:hypothetical protein